MAYTANVPQGTQRISDTQPLILGNFQDIPVLLDVNHYSFSSGDAGKHRFITMPQLAAAPAAFAANEMGLFVKNEALTAQSEMYVRRAASTDVPFTARDASTPAGWTYLPSGLIIKWNTFSTGGVAVSTVDTNTFGPTITTLLNVQLTVYNTAATDQDYYAYVRTLNSPAGGQFTALGVNRTTTGFKAGAFRWLAIGV